MSGTVKLSEMIAAKDQRIASLEQQVKEWKETAWDGLAANDKLKKQVAELTQQRDRLRDDKETLAYRNAELACERDMLKDALKGELGLLDTTPICEFEKVRKASKKALDLQCEDIREDSDEL